MENKHIIIILLIVIVVLSAAIAAALFAPSVAKEPSKINITSNSSQYEKGELSILLSDLNDTPISKEIVNITVTDDKGKVVVDDVVKTDAQGKAKLDLELEKGEYVVNASYGGNENYTGNSTVQKLTIKEEAVESQSDYSSSDDYVYSPQGDKYIKKSGQWDTDSAGNKVYTYQGGDGVIYERYYDSQGNEIDPETYYM